MSLVQIWIRILQNDADPLDPDFATLLTEPNNCVCSTCCICLFLLVKVRLRYFHLTIIYKNTTTINHFSMHEFKVKVDSAVLNETVL